MGSSREEQNPRLPFGLYIHAPTYTCGQTQVHEWENVLSKLNFLKFKWSTFEFLTAYAQEGSWCLSNPVYCKRHYVVFVLNFHEKKSQIFILAMDAWNRSSASITTTKRPVPEWHYQDAGKQGGHGSPCRGAAASLKIAFVLICFVLILFIIIIMWGVGQVHKGHQGLWQSDGKLGASILPHGKELSGPAESCQNSFLCNEIISPFLLFSPSPPI